MDEDEITQAIMGLPGVSMLVASEEGGAPEASWGDRFFYYDPLGERDFQRQPFATVVVNDYPGFDEASGLARDGVFRVNLHVGRDRFEQALGYLPADHPEHHDATDYATADTLLPHPVYGRQGWVCVVSPGASTKAEVRNLVVDAYDRAAERGVAEQ